MTTERDHINNYLNRLSVLLSEVTKDGTDTHTSKAEYGGGNSIEVDSALFLMGLVHRFNPLTIVETGTHWGFSSSFLATALAWHEESYPRQRQLHTIDVSCYEGR